MEIFFLRQAQKFIKKSSQELEEKIKLETLKIQTNPYQKARTLGGTLRGLFSHHFSYRGVEYRIVYKIEKEILIVAIGARENFYKSLNM
ncbi:type II toxin-antitoxin system RelE/ParE family toxin [Candidatus Peregrinibacteria bacterium]|nr:type II toxin-antitoxin system RelE/ParE family toxin [Candidatus Peregrinibacteria bacterium]